MLSTLAQFFVQRASLLQYFSVSLLLEAASVVIIQATKPNRKTWEGIGRDRVGAWQGDWVGVRGSPNPDVECFSREFWSPVAKRSLSDFATPPHRLPAPAAGGPHLPGRQRPQPSHA
jgi:hypothetical protein